VPHTLLLADDSVTIQRVIELTFADEDVQVVAVSDGDQAIARLESAPPDIVLADIGMPGRNGYEVARYVKHSPRLSHIPVVLLTGAFEPVDQARAIEVGCDGVLAKPFEPQLVISRVRELLASEPRKAQPASGAAAEAPPSAGPAAEATAAAAVASAEPSAATPEAADLDDYFDRLDVAFAKLSAQPLEKSAELESAEAAAASAEPGSRESLTDQIDWYAQQTETGHDLSVSYASPSSAFESPAPASTESEPAPGPSATFAAPSTPPPLAPVTAAEPAPAAVVPASVPAPLPSIADAFAAILAAEQHAPVPDDAPEWPRSFAPPPPAITAEVIDAVTRRVLDQMSDRVVRETVATIVADVAERLVREEIAKIKSALK
jgi:CheY-like chemotaxis protein